MNSTLGPLCLWQCFFSQISLLTTNKHPSFFLWIYFNSHYMFRRSGPDHMLLHTVLKQKGARLSFTFTCESKSKIQDKKKFTKILSWEKIDPLRGDPAPSPTVPLLQCPHGPSMPRFFSRTLLDVDVDFVEVDVLPLSLPPQTGDKDCDDGAPSLSGWLV